MMAYLPEIIVQIQESEISILVVRGKEIPFFCAGGDLRDVRRELLKPERGGEMCNWMTQQLQILCALPIYIIVVIQGAAIGGGAELMTIGDWIISERSAKIGFVQVSLGVTTGWGGAARLIERVGKTKALQILVSARRYSAEQALEIGLIDQVCDDANQALEDFLSKKKQLPQQSFRYAIAMMKGRISEEKAFVSTWGSMEHRSALGVSTQKTERTRTFGDTPD